MNDTASPVAALHHVAITTADLEASRRFYRDILGLPEVERPNFTFPGVWYDLGATTLHLIQYPKGTRRTGKPVDSWDTHFALRMASYRGTLNTLARHGYSADLDADDPRKLLLFTDAGFPQIFLLDPDGNVVELNAASIDS